MARYIDADKLVNFIKNSDMEKHEKNAALVAVQLQFTADVVEVVTCEKCAYRENCGQQIYLERSYTSIDWCSEGRKENRQ